MKVPTKRWRVVEAGAIEIPTRMSCFMEGLVLIARNKQKHGTTEI